MNRGWFFGLFFTGLLVWLLSAAYIANSQKYISHNDAQTEELGTIKADCLSIQRQISDMQAHIKGLEKTMIEHWKALDKKLKEKTVIAE